MSGERQEEAPKKSLEPFLRWAGGKRWLAKSVSPILKQLLQKTDGTYIEPFLGAGAMFFGLAPQRARLSDSNAALIATYQTIAKSARDVEQLVAGYLVSAESYYALREVEPVDSIEAAARFIFLNRTCYGGLYRENLSGKFNVPYGGGSRTPAKVLREALITRAQFALRGVRLSCCDFEQAIADARAGDIVYCDPTYSNVSRSAFDRYGATLFNWQDQERLAFCAEQAMLRGATVLVSNGSFDDLFDLYPAAYRIALKRKKTIGNNPADANRHREHLLILDPESRLHLWRSIGDIENRKLKRRYSPRYLVHRDGNRLTGCASSSGGQAASVSVVSGRVSCVWLSLPGLRSRKAR